MTWKKKIKKIILSGLISCSLFSIWIIYQYFKTGNPFTFIEVQDYWYPDRNNSVLVYLRTFIFANEWQSMRLSSILRHLFYFFLLISTFILLKQKNYLYIYLALSLFIIPLQGELINSFRFGAVLFPASARGGNESPPLMRMGSSTMTSLIILLS